MAASSLCSSSNLTLRQIRRCISEKGRRNFLAVFHFIHLTIGKHLWHTGYNLLPENTARALQFGLMHTSVRYNSNNYVSLNSVNQFM